MHNSLVYKILECVDLKEKNREQMYDVCKKKIQQSEIKKFTAFLNFVKKF